MFRMMGMHFPMNEDLLKRTDKHFFLMFDVFTMYYHNTSLYAILDNFFACFERSALRLNEYISAYMS